MHPSRIKTQEHTNSCLSHWQSDAWDLLTAHFNKKYVKFIIKSATSHLQCMKDAVLDGLNTNIHPSSSVRSPVYLGPAMCKDCLNMFSRHPVSPIKRACPSTSLGKPVQKNSCCTPQFFLTRSLNNVTREWYKQYESYEYVTEMQPGTKAAAVSSKPSGDGEPSSTLWLEQYRSEYSFRRYWFSPDFFMR